MRYLYFALNEHYLFLPQKVRIDAIWGNKTI